MTRITLGFFLLNPYPYPSTPYPYGEGYGFIMEMHRYIHETHGFANTVAKPWVYWQGLLRTMGTGDRRQVTGDRVVVVGMVVGRAGRGAATRPRRVSTVAAAVGVGVVGD